MSSHGVLILHSLYCSSRDQSLGTSSSPNSSMQKQHVTRQSSLLSWRYDLISLIHWEFKARPLWVLYMYLCVWGCVFIPVWFGFLYRKEHGQLYWKSWYRNSLGRPTNSVGRPLLDQSPPKTPATSWTTSSELWVRKSPASQSPAPAGQTAPLHWPRWERTNQLV